MAPQLEYRGGCVQRDHLDQGRGEGNRGGPIGRLAESRDIAESMQQSSVHSIVLLSNLLQNDLQGMRY